MSEEYTKAGVNIDEGNLAVKKIKERLKKYGFSKEIGKFGGMIKFENKYLVASADGVGTKVKVAHMAKIYGTVGQDLVNHCVNDILVQGAKPLFFMDYFATGKLNSDIVADIVEGLAKACNENDCILLGGETAEMPGMYNNEEFDLAGFIVGYVDERNIIDPSKITKGDYIYGLKSSGLHTNGYSLARKIFFEKLKMNPNDVFEPTGRTVAEELLMIHKSYFHDVYPLIEKGLIKGIAHITGGGFYDNIERILPHGLKAEINAKWEIPEIFKFLIKEGKLSNEEAYRVFNMGIGLIVVVDKDKTMPNEFIKIGEIKRGEGVTINF